MRYTSSERHARLFRFGYALSMLENRAGLQVKVILNDGTRCTGEVRWTDDPDGFHGHALFDARSGRRIQPLEVAGWLPLCIRCANTDENCECVAGGAR